MPAYSKNKLKTLHAKAAELGIITRSNMTGPKLEEKIAAVEGGALLSSVNPAPRGSKNGTAKPKAAPAAVKEKAAPKATSVANPSTTKGVNTKGKFLLFAVDGKEFSFIVESSGVTGAEAAQAAVSKELVAPNTPIVALPVSVLDEVIEVEAVTPPVQYVVKPSTAKKVAAPSKPKAAPKAAAAPAADPAVSVPAAAAAVAPKATSARKTTTSARKTTIAAPAAEPVPAVSTGNPFAAE